MVARRAAACDMQDAAAVNAFYEAPEPKVSSKSLAMLEKKLVKDVCACTKKLKKIAEKVRTCRQ